MAFAKPWNFYCDADPDGFRGIQWGTDIKTLSGMNKVGTNPIYGGIEVYARKGDDLQVCGVEVESITYNFRKGKFFFVQIECDNLHFKDLEDAVFKKFGRGYDPHKSATRRIWLGQRAIMSLEYDEASKKGDIFLSPNVLYPEEGDYERQMAKERAAKTF